MFQLIEGARIPGSEKLQEGYVEQDGWLRANVSAERIQALFSRFLDLDESELYSLWLEEPCREDEERHEPDGSIDRFHVKVYYLDGLFADDARHMLHLFAPLLIQDGLVRFGLVSQNGNELGKHKYGEIYAYSHLGDLRTMKKLFSRMDIPPLQQLQSPWDLICPENPGESRRITLEDKRVEDAIQALEQLGLYQAEIREDIL